MAEGLNTLGILRIETEGASELSGRKPEPPVILIQFPQFEMAGGLIRNRKSGQIFFLGLVRALLLGQQPAEFLVRLGASRVKLKRRSELALRLRVLSRAAEVNSQVPVMVRIAG